MELFEIGHEGNIGISKSKIFEIVEKALDKACEELENLSYVKGVGQVGMCYKEWKEWCMKDE